MSCPIPAGVSLGCYDRKGGNETIYLIETDNISTITEDASGNVTGITLAANKKFWEFECDKQVITFTETENTNRENGTVSYTHAVGFRTNGFSVAKRHTFKLVTQNRVTALIKDNNGNYLLVMRTGGAKIGSSATTGKMYADFNGYDTVLTSDEKEPMLFVDSSIVAALVTAAP